MNKEYLQENNLYEAHKQFMRLCEWSYVPKTLEEEGEDEQDPNSPMGNDMNQQQGQDDMGDMPPMGGEQPMDGPMMGGEEGEDGMNDMQSMDDNMAQQPMDDPMMGGEEGMDDPMMGGEQPMDDPMMGGDMGEDEEVIDVDDITNAQEKMNSKVNTVGKDLGKVDDKIEALMNAISNMEKMINNNNAEIASFKQEFEKRNPTQTEKLNLRSLDSYPFNVNPKEYWAKKGIDPNSNYSGEFDNDESTTERFEITNNDVDNFDNKTIEDSFSIDDDLRQSIEKIFNL